MLLSLRSWFHKKLGRERGRKNALPDLWNALPDFSLEDNKWSDFSLEGGSAHARGARASPSSTPACLPFSSIRWRSDAVRL